LGLSLTLESKLNHSPTPGGYRLRTLREALGRTQLDVELDAELGSGYLQRVESGKVQHPERATLERILTALNAPYTERRDILELFGYLVGTSLPTPEETTWAIHACQAVLDSMAFPAYLLDCTHRLIAWNRFTPLLFSVSAMDRLASTSMLRILFDPACGVANLIANPDSFYPATLRALRYEMRLFRGEAWYAAVIEDMMRIPRFAQHWFALDGEALYPAPARPLIPIQLDVPAAGLLTFRLASEALAEDRRFRIIYYLPANADTMRQCALWSDTL
jgi:transcriptional regulator with XRE-family HTH domain